MHSVTSKPLLYLLLLSLQFASFGTAFAQNEIPYEIRKAVAEALKTTPDDPQIIKLLRSPGEMARTNLLNMPELTGPTWQAPSDLTVIKHIRSEQGQEFIKPLETADVQKENSTRQEQIPTSASVHSYLERSIKNVNKLRQSPELSRCESARTFSQPLTNSATEGLDILVYNSEDPLDPDILFGQNTQLVHYMPNSSDPISSIYSQIGLQCLPYRIRVAKKVLFIHEGDDALRNFDRDPLGRGIDMRKKGAKNGKR